MIVCQVVSNVVNQIKEKGNPYDCSQVYIEQIILDYKLSDHKSTYITSLQYSLIVDVYITYYIINYCN